MTDPLTLIAADGAPNIAIDVQPDGIDGTFVLDVSELDGPDLLGWGEGDEGAWLNIACDVTSVRIRRGATRLQGPLTRAEAGSAVIEVLDHDRRFDPLMNADAIHAGTPLRVRAWGVAPQLTPVESRRNLLNDPGVTTPGQWAASVGGTGAQQATGGLDGGAFYRITSTGAAATLYRSSLDQVLAPAGGYVLIAGQTYTASLYVRTNTAGHQADPYVSILNAAGGTIRQARGVQTALTVGVWHRLTVTFTAAATEVGFRMGPALTRVAGGNVAAGVTLDIDSGMLERAAVAGPYFDGGSTARRNLLANPSSETAVALLNAGAGNVARTLAAAYVGEASTSLTSIAAGMPSALVPDTPVTPGEPYTYSTYARAAGASRTVRVDLRFVTATGATIGSDTVGTAVPVTAGSWDARPSVTATAPAGAVYARPIHRVPGVLAAGEVVWFDALMLEQSAELGDYIEGGVADTGDTEGDRTFAWTGAANASASVESVATLVEGPWSAVLFTGHLDDLPVTYAHTGPPQVRLTAYDRIAELASWQAPGRDEPGVGAGDDLLGRVLRVLAEMGVPATVVAEDVDEAYATTLAPTTLTDAWREVADAADAELGRVWVDTANRLVVRARESELTGPVRGTLSDWHGETVAGPHCCYAELDAALDTANVTNRAIAARRVPRDPEALEPPAASAVAQVDDLGSQASIRRVRTTERRDLELETDEQLGPWAEALVAAAGLPELVVDRVTPAPWGAGAAAWLAVCSTDIGDRWPLRHHPEIGPTVLRTVGVLGIEHEIGPDGWSVTWATVPAPTPGDDNPSGWFTLDVSELDGEDVLPPPSVLTVRPGV